jgi:hypothetical protein
MTNDLEKFINHNREAFDKERPDPAVLNRVLEQMQAKTKPERTALVIPFSTIRWVAASVILLAGALSFWVLLNRPQTITPAIVKNDPPTQTKNQEAVPVIAKVEPEAPKAIDVVDEDLALRKRMLMARYKEKQVVLAGLNDMESPASRITAVTNIYKLKNSGNDVTNVLVKTLNTDPNANVRLAALDGLARFYREDNVREKLVASLKKQQEPIVQIALIELLTRIRASGILTELEKLAGDETNMKGVRDCAYSNMLRLKSS